MANTEEMAFISHYIELTREADDILNEAKQLLEAGKKDEAVIKMIVSNNRRMRSFQIAQDIDMPITIPQVSKWPEAVQAKAYAL